MRKRLMEVVHKLVRDDRGDLLVTPAILLLAIAGTFVLGGLTFYSTRQVAPAVTNSRQGVQLDDEGNVVQGAVGFVPVATPKPTATPEPKPKVITKTEVVEVAPQQPQQESVIVLTPPEDPYSGHSGTSGGTSTNNHTESSTSGGSSGGGGGGDGHGGGGHHPDGH